MFDCVLSYQDLEDTALITPPEHLVLGMTGSGNLDSSFSSPATELPEQYFLICTMRKKVV